MSGDPPLWCPLHHPDCWDCRRGDTARRRERVWRANHIRDMAAELKTVLDAQDGPPDAAR